jgi:hypothetical protein
MDALEPSAQPLSQQHLLNVSEGVRIRHAGCFPASFRLRDGKRLVYDRRADEGTRGAAQAN